MIDELNEINDKYFEANKRYKDLVAKKKPLSEIRAAKEEVRKLKNAQAQWLLDNCKTFTR